MTNRRPEVVTFGCRLNAHESEVIAERAARAGAGDAVIVNTCAVTAEAERQARQTIRRLARQRPEARLIVTGCAAQIDPRGYAAMPEVDRVIGNAEKLLAESYRDTAEHVRVGDIMAVRETAGHLVAGLERRARAFLQVQNGCDHRCTFCVIPYGRGNSRSVPMGELVRQAAELVEHGYREIVLTGVDLTSYGADLPGQPTLGQMVRRLLAAVPGLPRLRLSSIDAAEIDDELWWLLAEEGRLMPHLHLSLQSGDDMVLKRMKRRHSREDAVAFCHRARKLRPDIVFGADLITGFPTETEEMFRNTLALVEDCGLTYLHVFPYSARAGTPAARMPQVPVKTRKDRAARLRAAGEAAFDRFLKSQHGQTVEIVAERHADGDILGHSRQFAPVRVHAAAVPAIGELLNARVTGQRDGVLHAAPFDVAA